MDPLRAHSACLAPAAWQIGCNIQGYVPGGCPSDLQVKDRRTVPGNTSTRRDICLAGAKVFGAAGSL